MTCEDLKCELKTLYVIITVILQVLQLFVVTTGEDPINRLINPNPLRNHPDTLQYYSIW
jgi:hypothetical protein